MRLQANVVATIFGIFLLLLVQAVAVQAVSCSERSDHYFWYWSERRCAGGLAAANVVATIFGIFLLFSFLFSFFSFLTTVAKTP